MNLHLIIFFIYSDNNCKQLGENISQLKNLKEIQLDLGLYFLFK